MARLTSLLALVAFGIFHAIAAPVDAVLESIASPPSPWQSVDELPPANQLVKLRISLKQQNIDKLEATILEVSTPGHARHGEFKTRDEIEELLSPSENTYNTIVSWLEDAGVSDYTRLANGWLGVSTNVETANVLLDAKFQWFTRGDDTERYLRTLSYALPKKVASEIEFITPTNDFPIEHDAAHSELRRSGLTGSVLHQRQSSTSPPVDNNCTNGFTPECVRKLYNDNRNFGATTGAGKISFASFYGYDVNETDFENFKAWLLPAAIDTPFTTTNLLNATPPVEGFFDSEPSMDLEALTTIAYPLPVEQFRILGPLAGGVGPGYLNFVSDPSGSTPYNSLPLNEFVEALLSMDDDDLPHTLSISWGTDEYSLYVPIAKKICQGFGQLAARGMSVFVSSGDYGVGKACLIRDPVSYPRFSPKFPSTCPWVTSVGGTRDSSPEVAAGLSGGGFSEVFPRPAYQEESVSKYFKDSPPDVNTTLYHARGRGYPDIAALSVNLYYVHQGYINTSGGTSAAAPLVAGVFGFMNAELVKRGRKPMGLVNPWLYKHGAAALMDITSGDKNEGCHAFGGSNFVYFESVGFTPEVGWDPVTGLGSPNFGKIYDLIVGG